MRRLCIALVISVLAGTCLAQTRPIDPQRSVLTVHVFKSGVFSAFADNHEIRAPISGGTVDEATKRVDLVIDSRKLVVLDPNLPPDKRQQVQEKMLGPEVFDSSQFREIRFDASSIKQEAPDRFLVSGNLSLLPRLITGFFCMSLFAVSLIAYVNFGVRQLRLRVFRGCSST